MKKSILIILIFGLGGYLGYHLTRPICSDNIFTWLPQTHLFVYSRKATGEPIAKWSKDGCEPVSTITEGKLRISLNTASPEEFFQLATTATHAEGWTSKQLGPLLYEFECADDCSALKVQSKFKIKYYTESDEIEFIDLKVPN